MNSTFSNFQYSEMKEFLFSLEYFDPFFLGVGLSLIFGFLIYAVCVQWSPIYMLYDFTWGFECLKSHGSSASQAHYINILRKAKKGVKYPYPNGWFPVLQSGELKKGQATELKAFGKDLVVYRGQSGKAYIADAYCPHIGAHLGVGGIVKDDCIKCGFHGWEFEGETGNCTSIPYAKKVPKGTKIKMWEVTEVNCTIYIWYHAKGEGPSYQPTIYPPMIAERYRGKAEYLMSVSCEEIQSNAADYWHFPVVHDPSYLNGGKPWGPWFFNIVSNTKWLGTFGLQPDKEDKHKCLTNICTENILFGKNIFTTFAQGELDGPSTIVLPAKLFGFIAHFYLAFYPIDELHSRFFQYLYIPKYVPQFICQLIVRLGAFSIARDHIFWGRKVDLKNPIIVAEEKSIIQFKRWFSQFYCSDKEKGKEEIDGNIMKNGTASNEYNKEHGKILFENNSF